MSLKKKLEVLFYLISGILSLPFMTMAFNMVSKPSDMSVIMGIVVMVLIVLYWFILVPIVAARITKEKGNLP